MNTPANGAQSRTFRLPAPNPNVPLLNRVVSSPIFKEQSDALMWKVGEDHPMASGWKIVRMFLDGAGVEVYALPPSNGSGHFTRNFIPIASVRFTEEIMSVEVFVEELTAAEEEDADDDDDPDDSPEVGEGAEATASDNTSS